MQKFYVKEIDLEKVKPNEKPNYRDFRTLFFAKFYSDCSEWLVKHGYRFVSKKELFGNIYGIWEGTTLEKGHVKKIYAYIREGK